MFRLENNRVSSANCRLCKRPLTCRGPKHAMRLFVIVVLRIRSRVFATGGKRWGESGSPYLRPLFCEKVLPDLPFTMMDKFEELSKGDK